MSFSASTCLTNTGTTELGPTLYFYSDVDGYQGSFGSTSTNNLVGGNCPYIMENIPDGTTIVRIIDPITNCCVNITLQSSDLCNICNLNFDVYETQTVSQIIAGNLVGSCDDNISDYIINWYGPGESSTNLAFTSGYGTEFTNIGWNFTHPLTEEQSPLIEAGIYTPVIDRVIVNGVTYSTTGAPGSYIANLDCFNSAKVNVDALRCDNGNNVGNYSHHYLFDNVTVGVPPESLSASFFLSANTNYLAWRFRGFDVEDRLKLIFYGSTYDNEPIVIEDITIGSNQNNSNFSDSTIPKRADINDFYAKVTCLTAFTISESDYVTIQITPNPINNNTKWDFYFKCLETFDCSSCLDNFKNAPYKIITSSITSTLLACNRNSVSYRISGCSQDELSQSDTYKYFNTGQQGFNFYFNSFSEIEWNPTLWFQNIGCSSQFIYNVNDGSCSPQLVSCDIPSNNTITYQKSIINGQGYIEIEFSSFSDLEHYYNSYLSLIDDLGIFYDNTQINYYRYFSLKLPLPQNPLEQCGDTTIYKTYNIHCSSVVTTGDTSPTGPYFMTLTMPTIINNINFSSCDLNCTTNVNNIVNTVNYNSTTTSNNIDVTSNVGSKYIAPFYCGKRILISVGSYSSDTRNGSFLLNKYSNETIPYSGISNTIIPSLSAQTCQFWGNSVTRTDNPSIISHQQYVYTYKTVLFDENNVSNFRMYGTPITNFQYSGATVQNGWSTIYELALEYSGGTITYQNPYYCI